MKHEINKLKSDYESKQNYAQSIQSEIELLRNELLEESRKNEDLTENIKNLIIEKDGLAMNKFKKDEEFHEKIKEGIDKEFENLIFV